MSFSVDLWNGIEQIKNQISSVQRKIKTFAKLLTAYITIETNYSRNLESLYKEYKENNIPEFLLDESFQKIIEIFDYENKNKKIYINYLVKTIMEPLNAYLEKPKTKLSKCLNDNFENTENFNRTLILLKEKQSLFHNVCRELSSYLVLMEIDEINKTNKTSKNKCQKILDRVNYAKEDYLNLMKDANKEREKYNLKTEEILNNLEEIYRMMVDSLKEYLLNFTTFRLEFYKGLISKEQKEYDNIHLKIDTNQEILNFIMKNVTKEFPLIKFEFCPIKYSELNKYIKNKFNKLNKNDFPKIFKTIKDYFDSNNIFKDELVIKSNKKTNDFFSRRFTFFGKKPSQTNNDQDDNIRHNKEFIEKYLTKLFTDKKTENKNEINKEDNKDNIENIKEDKTEKKEENQNKETNQDKIIKYLIYNLT